MKRPSIDLGRLRDRFHVAPRFAHDAWAPFKVAMGMVVMGILDGPVGALVALVIGLELLFTGSVRRLLFLSIPCFALLLAWNLVRGLPNEDAVSSLWVLDNPLAHHLAFAGFAFLVTGLVLAPPHHADEPSP